MSTAKLDLLGVLGERLASLIVRFGTAGFEADGFVASSAGLEGPVTNARLPETADRRPVAISRASSGGR